MGVRTNRLGSIAHLPLVLLGASFLTAPGTALAAATITPVIAAIDRNTATWQVRYAASAGPPDATFAYGLSSWVPLVGNWSGTGNEGIGEFDPNTATWYLRDTASAGAPTITPFPFGSPQWKPVSGHWTAGSIASGIGAFDPATATWYLRNTPSAGPPSVTPFAFGAPGFIPVTGDWNGDGTDGIGVFDPATATWFLRNSLSAGPPDLVFTFGAPGWLPVAGDWNGDGATGIGAIDPTTETWYLRNSLSPGAPQVSPFAFGGPGSNGVSGEQVSVPEPAGLSAWATVLLYGAMKRPRGRASRVRSASITGP